MTPKRKTHLTGARRAFQITFYFLEYLRYRVLTTERIQFTTEYPMRCKVSLKHCEFVNLFGWLPFKKDQFLFYLEWITVLPLTATTSKACFGLCAEERVQASLADAWKVGELTKINNYGREK